MTVKNSPRLVHVFSQTPYHYLPMRQFFEMIDEKVVFSQHFWAWAHPEQETKAGFFYYQDNNDLITQMSAEPVTTRFVFHGMFTRRLWLKLVMSSLPKRCTWVCWGAELYQHKLEPSVKRSLKGLLALLLHNLLVRRLQCVFSLNQGDGELIKQLLCQREVEVLPYPLIGSSGIETENSDSATKTILIGNSGTPSNEHIEALSWLAHLAEHPIKIVVPLNYGGDPEYIETVVNHGKSLFAGKFIAITDMLDKRDYDKLLASVDVCVFGHHRQQGLYVVYSVFTRQKKMYIRSNTSSYEGLKANGFVVFPSENIANQGFDEFVRIDAKTTEHNAKLMQFTFSQEALLPKWHNAFRRLFK
jgi:dTDP-N-acetylfucosamine:lipid II N-acetylfucosaminyltransferase